MKRDYRKLVVCGMMSAVSVVLAVTPLGFIPLGPVSITLLHLPVILAALLEGPIAGGVVGLVFGLFSLYRAVVAPTDPTAVFFINPLVSVLPRLLIGPAAYFVHSGVQRVCAAHRRGRVWASAAGAVAGSLTNTVGVLGMLYLVYLGQFAQLLGISTQAAGLTILGAALTNGLPEAIAAAVILVPTVLALSRMRRSR